MLIPREIAEKAQEYLKLMEAANQARAEVVSWLDKNTGSSSVYVGDLFIVNRPKGESMRAEGEFCDRSDAWCEDGGCGSYYHKIDGMEGYLGYSYEC